MKFNWGTILGIVSVFFTIAVILSTVAVWFTDWRTTADFRYDALEAEIGDMKSRMGNLENEIRALRALIEERLPLK